MDDHRTLVDVVVTIPVVVFPAVMITMIPVLVGLGRAGGEGEHGTGKHRGTDRKLVEAHWAYLR